MNAPVVDMSLVVTEKTFILLDVMASSFKGSLIENLLDRRCSFTENSFLLGFTINSYDAISKYHKSQILSTPRARRCRPKRASLVPACGFNREKAKQGAVICDI